MKTPGRSTSLRRANRARIGGTGLDTQLGPTTVRGHSVPRRSASLRHKRLRSTDPHCAVASLRHSQPTSQPADVGVQIPGEIVDIEARNPGTAGAVIDDGDRHFDFVSPWHFGSLYKGATGRPIVLSQQVMDYSFGVVACSGRCVASVLRLMDGLPERS